jgi:cytochrome c-type biogenesis protein CcsB
MAALSDALLVVTIFAYLAAMVCHAVEYAFARSPVLATRGASAPPPAARLTTGILPRLSVAALVLAASAHLATLATRGIAADRLPWGNMYEYLLTATFVGVVAWLWMLRRIPGIKHLGLYVSLVNVLLLGLAWVVVYTPVGPLQPALNSYWRVIHVAAAITATGLFLVGFVGAAMYLIRAGYDRGSRRFPYTLGARIPAAEAVERLTFRLHAIAFPVWTFAVAAGSIWAEAAWGRYWGWDPKETWAFITWVVYACYLHARATPSVRRTAVAWLAVAGWLTMMMNLWGVNLFFEGLHSYA